MALSDTLAEIEALTQEQQGPKPPPAPGMPGRPAAIAAPPKAPSAPPAKKKSLLDTAGDVAKKAIGLATDTDTYKAAGASIIRAPGLLMGGAVDTLADVDRWMSDNISPQYVRQTVTTMPSAALALKGASALRKANAPLGASLADVLSFRSSVGQVGNPQVNQVAGQGLAIAGGLLTGGTEAKAAVGILPRVTRLLGSSAKVGLLTGVTADTSHSPDPLKERAKETAVGAAVNVVAEPLLAVVGGYIASKVRTKVTTAEPHEAAADALDRDFASARTSEARYQAQEAKAKAGPDASPSEAVDPPEPQQELAAGTRHSDAHDPANDGGAANSDPARADAKGRPSGDADGASPGGGDRGSSDPAAVAYQDANSALEAAGAAERVDPSTHPLRPDGKIPVEPATKQALDEAGLGRAFAVRESLPAIPPKPQPGAGDLWKLSQEELDRLAADKQLSDKDKLIQALGSPEAAAEFERLDRTRNSMDPARADKASAEFDAKYGDLTPEQERLIYGIGETDAQLGDIRQVAEAHSDVMPGDSSEWLSYMAAVGARALGLDDLTAIASGQGSAKAQAAFVRMGRAYEGLRAAGTDPNDIPRLMVDALVNHAGWAPGQAEEIIGHFVDDLLKLRSQKAVERLPDPIIFKETDEAGGSRVVGAIDKEALQGFKDEVDAIRFDGDTPLDLDSSHPAGQWKLSNLGAPFDVPPFLRALAEQLPERATLTDAALMTAAKKMADDIGWDPEDMIAYAAHVAGDASSMPQAMATIRTVYARAGAMVDELMDAHPDWTAVPDDAAELGDVLKAVHNIITLAQSVAEFKSAAGQTLRVAGLPDADAYLEGFFRPKADMPPTNPIDGLPRLPRNKEELKQWLDAWRYTKGDPELREAFLKGLTFMPGKWLALRTSFANFFTAAIISGPATILRNFVGPFIIGGLRTIERTSGGYAAALNPFIDAASRESLLRSASQAPLAYLQTIGSFADAARASLKAFQRGGQVLQEEGIYNLRSKTIPDGLIEAATGNPPGLLNMGSYPYMLANAVNIFPQFIHTLHGGTNEFAQRLSYLGEVRAAAMLEAAEQRLSAEDAKALVKQRLMESTDEVTWAAKDKDALASSQRTTLIKQMSGEYQPVVKRFSDFIHTLRTNFPESRYVLPIFTVPANAIGEGIRRVPVVGQLFRETRAELSGELGAAAQAEAYGRILTGSAFMLSGFAMARAGLLTGPGPQDAQDRAIWLAQGFQPYSIRVGDHWVSYNRMDVVGNLLAIPAAIYDKSVHTQLDNNSATFAGIAAIAQYFKDQAALQGVSDLLSFGGSPQESQSFLKRLTNQTASGFVPNFITQIGRNNLDPSNRIANNPWEAILNKLPGASQVLDPQRNPLGEMTYKVQNAGFGFLPISITKANSYKEDPVIDELDRLYEVTGYAPGLKSPALPGGKVDMRTIKLEDGHSLYDALMRYRTVATDDGGLTLREALQALITSPEYMSAVDGDASNLTTANGDLDRGALVSRLFQQFDKAAQHEVAKASPIAARYLAIGAIKQGNDAYLRDTPTHDLAQNPALLDSLGINVRDFEDKVRGE